MSVPAALREILRNRGVRAEAIDPATPLGGDGLGLDSIAIAEVLLDCEMRLVGHLADRLAERLDAR
jgi:acyl carrier protein